MIYIYFHKFLQSWYTTFNQMYVNMIFKTWSDLLFKSLTCIFFPQEHVYEESNGWRWCSNFPQNFDLLISRWYCLGSRKRYTEQYASKHAQPYAVFGRLWKRSSEDLPWRLITEPGGLYRTVTKFCHPEIVCVHRWPIRQ